MSLLELSRNPWFDALLRGVESFTRYRESAEVYWRTPDSACNLCGQFSSLGQNFLTIYRPQFYGHAVLVKKLILRHLLPTNGAVFEIPSRRSLSDAVSHILPEMVNLESFVWEAPVLITKSVWRALAAHKRFHVQRGRAARLKNIWIRFPNRDHGLLRTTPGLCTACDTAFKAKRILEFLSTRSKANHLTWSYMRTESPDFSILPALESITVLDIDEIAHMAELSILVARSAGGLRELCLGLPARALEPWTCGTTRLVNSDPSSLVGHCRSRGVLEIVFDRLLASIYPASQPSHDAGETSGANDPMTANFLSLPLYNDKTSLRQVRQSAEPPSCPVPLKDEQLDSVEELCKSISRLTLEIGNTKGEDQYGRWAKPTENPKLDNTRFQSKSRRASHGLKLDTLELRYMPLMASVLRHAIDWTQLTYLALINCYQNDELWTTLMREFAPHDPHEGFVVGTAIDSKPPCWNYPLKLGHIQTDWVSQTLILFLSRTLAPNSLTSLFLQDTPDRKSPVSLELIVLGPLSRHQISLRKVYVHSKAAQRNKPGWNKWTFSKQIVPFLNKMTNLEEVSIDLAQLYFVSYNVRTLEGIKLINFAR